MTAASFSFISLSQGLVWCAHRLHVKLRETSRLLRRASRFGVFISVVPLNPTSFQPRCLQRCLAYLQSLPTFQWRVPLSLFHLHLHFALEFARLGSSFHLGVPQLRRNHLPRLSCKLFGLRLSRTVVPLKIVNDHYIDLQSFRTAANAF